MQEQSFGRVGVISMSMKLLLQAAMVLAATVLFFILSAQPAYADAGGDFKFTITAQSGGGAVTGVMVSIACTGGTINSLGLTSSTGTLFVTPTAGASCGAGDSYIDYALEKSGMVTYRQLPGGSHETDELNAVTTTMLYAVRVEVTDQAGTAFTHSGLDVITLNSIAASTTLSNASLFGNTGSGITLAVAENGYVAATTTNFGLTNITPVSSSQFIITFASSTGVAAAITSATTTVRGLLFSHRVLTQRENDSRSLPGATVSAGGVTCSEESSNTGTYFCPVLVAGDGGTDDIHILLDGYVKDVTGDTPNRDGNAAPVATTTVSSIDFSNKVTLLGNSNSAVSGATVTSGDGFGTTCTEEGTLGVYYCPIPLAHTSRTARFVKAGYTTRESNWATDRSVSNTAQVTLSYNEFSADQSGSGSGTTVVTKPVITSITLGDGSGTTATTAITITVVGSNILRYKIALTQAGLTAAEYPQYPGTAIPYTLSAGDGLKTLWFQFMSTNGGETTATSKTITLNSAAIPATPATPAVPATPATPVAPLVAPKVSVPVVLLIDLPKVPTVITQISAKAVAPDFTPVSIAVLQEGDLFMIEDATAGASVYWFTGGYKRPFSSEKAFLSWFPSFDRISIKRVKKDEITYLAWGPSMPYKPGTRMIKVPDDVKTYNIQVDGSVCHVKNEADATKLFGKMWNKNVDDMAVSQLLGTYKIKDECVVS